MKEYDVYELHEKIVGKAIEEENGKISLLLDNTKGILYLQEKKKEIHVTTQNKKRNATEFTNKIIEEVSKTYDFHDWKEEAIKELSLYLNNYYQSVKSNKALFHDFENILKNHYIPVSRGRVYAHIRYFVVDGRLIKNGDYYEIQKDILIPKTKVKKELGILDELGM